MRKINPFNRVAYHNDKLQIIYTRSKKSDYFANFISVKDLTDSKRFFICNLSIHQITSSLWANIHDKIKSFNIDYKITKCFDLFYFDSDLHHIILLIYVFEKKFYFERNNKYAKIINYSFYNYVSSNCRDFAKIYYLTSNFRKISDSATYRNNHHNSDYDEENSDYVSIDLYLLKFLSSISKLKNRKPELKLSTCNEMIYNLLNYIPIGIAFLIFNKKTTPFVIKYFDYVINCPDLNKKNKITKNYVNLILNRIESKIDESNYDTTYSFLKAVFNIRLLESDISEAKKQIIFKHISQNESIRNKKQLYTNYRYNKKAPLGITLNSVLNCIYSFYDYGGFQCVESAFDVFENFNKKLSEKIKKLYKTIIVTLEDVENLINVKPIEDTIDISNVIKNILLKNKRTREIYEIFSILKDKKYKEEFDDDEHEITIKELFGLRN